MPPLVQWKLHCQQFLVPNVIIEEQLPGGEGTRVNLLIVTPPLPPCQCPKCVNLSNKLVRGIWEDERKALSPARMKQSGGESASKNYTTLDESLVEVRESQIPSPYPAVC